MLAHVCHLTKDTRGTASTVLSERAADVASFLMFLPFTLGIDLAFAPISIPFFLWLTDEHGHGRWG